MCKVVNAKQIIIMKYMDLCRCHSFSHIIEFTSSTHNAHDVMEAVCIRCMENNLADGYIVLHHWKFLFIH